MIRYIVICCLLFLVSCVSREVPPVFGTIELSVSKDLLLNALNNFTSTKKELMKVSNFNESRTLNYKVLDKSMPATLAINAPGFKIIDNQAGIEWKALSTVEYVMGRYMHRIRYICYLKYKSRGSEELVTIIESKMAFDFENCSRVDGREGEKTYNVVRSDIEGQ
jgi:hypothetical protein